MVANEANNAAAIASLIEIQRFLHTIVGLTRTKFVAVAADKYEDFMDFENMQWGSIEKWISTSRKSNLNRWGFSVSAEKEKRIQALALWVNDSLRIGRLKVEADFYETEFITIKMTEMVNETYINYLDCNTVSDVSTTEEFSFKKVRLGRIQWKIGSRLK